MEYTQENFEKEVQKEVDRRVNVYVDNHKEEQAEFTRKEVEKAMAKAKEEALAESKLSAEEKAKKEMEDYKKSLETKERELNLQSNTLTAREKLASAGVPAETSEKLLKMLVTNDADSTDVNVTEFIDVFSNTKSEIESNIKATYANIKQPKLGGNGSDDKKSLKDMTLEERIELKANNPDEFHKMMDSSNNSFNKL